MSPGPSTAAVRARSASVAFRQLILATAVATAGIVAAKAQGPSTETPRKAVWSEDARDGEPATSETSPDRPSVEPVPETGSRQRIREGTRIAELPGTFQWHDERLSFAASDGANRFKVLENQTMERVRRALEERSPNAEWNVSGVITEYDGANYLLLTRAVFRRG